MNCPSCHQPIEEDFGVITCSHCGAVMMVGMDGASSEPYEAQESHESVREEEVHPSAEAESIESELDSQYAEVVSHLESAVEVEQYSPTETGDPAAETHAPESEESDSDLDSFFNPTDAEEASPIDSVDVTDYAQSEVSAANEGVLLYDVVICRRPSHSEWDELFSILQDTRFRLDVDELKRSMVNDCVVIKNFGPAKTAALLNRLNLQMYDVTWKQKHLFKSEEF